MEAEKMSANSCVIDDDITSSIDGPMQLSNGVKGSESLGDILLEDLDSYLEDINVRLMISRMVNDSVIKGMMNAVEQEAAETIAAKELEVAEMKKAMHSCFVGAYKNESMVLRVAPHELNGLKQRDPGLSITLKEHDRLRECLNNLGKTAKEGLKQRAPGFPVTLREHDRLRECLNNLGKSTEEQFKKLKKEIDKMNGCSSIKKINSSSELVELGGILHEKVSERGIDIDKTFETLKNTLEATYRDIDDMVYLSKVSLSEWQLEQEFRGEVEATVIRNSIGSLQEEFEERLWDQNAQFCGCQTENSQEKLSVLSSLRQELDAIFKSLSMHETGHVTTHGYESSDEWNNAKRVDHFHHKVLNNHSLLEGNDKQDDSKTTLPENLESSQLNHFSKEKLFKYFKAEVTKMKRNHESQVQEMTEEYYSLKREFFKERDPFLSLKKDKEFDILKKKIPEVISRLEYILMENEKLPSSSSNLECLSSLKNRMEVLLLENRQLRDLLADKKKEAKFLSSLVSDAEEKLSHHSLAEARMLKTMESLRRAITDAHIEAFISEDVYKCVLSEVTSQINCDIEQFDLESVIMQEIYRVIFRDAVQNGEATIEFGIEDSEIESTIMQGLCTIIFNKAYKDAEKQLGILENKCIRKNELIASLEKKVLEAERALGLESKERERIKEEMFLLAATIKEKDKFGEEVTVALEKEREQFELASRELHSFKELVSEQHMLISNGSKELEFKKGELIDAVEKIELYKAEVENLNHKMELAMKQFSEADEERTVLLAVVQEKQNILALDEAKERDNRKKLASAIVLVHKLLEGVADCECKVAEAIQVNSFRLQNSSSQLNYLIQKASTLRRTGALFKRRFERRCSDLQKAETEVDLLGDEVDALLSLLEKIYIALDHYSPILQHYPGIMEILRMIKRELSGEATKQV